MENKNIFEMLPEQDNSSDEEKRQKDKAKQKKQKERNEFQEKQKYAENQGRQQVKPENKKPVGVKTDLQKKQEKKVTAEPHPLDRKSGTGRGKEMKKQGGGAGNWGNTQDIVDEDKYVKKDEESTYAEKVEEKEEEKEVITLDDYKTKYNFDKEQAVQQKKENVDLSEFLKEGCQLITRKGEKNADDEPKKKQKNAIKDYSAGMTTEHTELLGLKTGFKPIPEKKPRRQFEEKKFEKEEPKEVKEGEEKKEEAVEGQKEEQEHQPTRGGRPYRGKGRGGRQDRGNNRQGQGYYKKDYADEPKKNVQKVIEDESNFPKLG